MYLNWHLSHRGQFVL